MKDRTKNLIVIISFCFLLIVVFIANILKKDISVSTVERRKLASFPKINKEEIFNGKFSSKFENYAMDQFVYRDTFRKIKYFFNSSILNQQDTNNFFIEDEIIYKMEYPLNEGAIKKSAEKIQNVCEKYLAGMNTYYAVIPDKTYLLGDDHLSLDYDKIIEIMEDKITDAKYINIIDTLQSSDYYKTDLHWKQENIKSTVSRIKSTMNLENNSEYEIKQAGNFYGVYYGQSTADITADKINYLTNEVIENCNTYNFETDTTSKVYDLEKYNTSSDKYDIFLSGATPLIEIDNPSATTDKELILFRDSFGSSIAPYFIENYKKITLVDIRYISTSILENYIDFDNQDVLFLYSGIILNQNVLK